MSDWTKDKPTLPGLYKIRCGETDGKEYFVAITQRKNILIVHDQYLGETMLESFHDGLTSLEWLHVA